MQRKNPVNYAVIPREPSPFQQQPSPVRKRADSTGSLSQAGTPGRFRGCSNATLVVKAIMSCSVRTAFSGLPSLISDGPFYQSKILCVSMLGIWCFSLPRICCLLERGKIWHWAQGRESWLQGGSPLLTLPVQCGASEGVVGKRNWILFLKIKWFGRWGSPDPARATGASRAWHPSAHLQGHLRLVAAKQYL